LSAVRHFLDAIKFEHTVFALPFAYVAMVLAAGGWPGWGVVIWVTLAMVGARTLAMSVNRLAIDVLQMLSVDATSTIDVSGRGYTGSVSGYGRTWSATSPTGATTGGSYNGSGGSHGGRGGAHEGQADSAQAYGSVHDPNTPGGAGGQWQNATCNPCNTGGGIEVDHLQYGRQRPLDGGQVPEPSTLILLAAGFGGFVVLRRRN